MSINEIKGEQAVDALADMMEPLAEILADEEVQAVTNKPKLIIAKTVLKRHKKEVLDILAVLNGEDPAKFNPSLVQLPLMVISLLNEIQAHEELKSLF